MPTNAVEHLRGEFDLIYDIDQCNFHGPELPIILQLLPFVPGFNLVGSWCVTLMGTDVYAETRAYHRLLLNSFVWNYGGTDYCPFPFLEVAICKWSFDVWNDLRVFSFSVLTLSDLILIVLHILSMDNGEMRISFVTVCYAQGVWMMRFSTRRYVQQDIVEGGM